MSTIHNNKLKLMNNSSVNRIQNPAKVEVPQKFVMNTSSREEIEEDIDPDHDHDPSQEKAGDVEDPKLQSGDNNNNGGGEDDSKLPQNTKFNRLFRTKEFCRRNLLTLMVFFGVIAGIILGLVLKSAVRKNFWTSRTASYVGFPGELFISMLRCMVVPLITTSIIAAIGTVNIRMGKFIAARGISFYMCTTLLAVALGIILVETIRPGERGNRPTRICRRTYDSRTSRSMEFQEWVRNYGQRQTGKNEEGQGDAGVYRSQLTMNVDDNRQGGPCVAGSASNTCHLIQDTLLDLVRSLFPANIFQATIELPQTQPDLTKPNNPNDTKYNTCQDYHQAPQPKKSLADFEMKTNYSRGTNIIGLIVFSIALAVAAVQAGPAGRAMITFFVSLSEVILIITTWIIWISPFGVMSLVAAQVLLREDLMDLLTTLGFYFLTVLVGLLIHSLFVLPTLYFLLTRKNPVKLIGHMSSALTTAFGTSSSSATVPVTIRCLEQNAGIDPRVVRFLIPIGATINLDGTALYEAVAAIYISQLHGMNLSFADTLLVSITATVASIGAAGIPSAGIVTMVLVLNSIGLPAELVSYIIPVDWFLDRFRTACNVLGDSVVAAIVHSISQGKLQKLTQMEEESVDPKASESTIQEGIAAPAETNDASDSQALTAME